MKKLSKSALKSYKIHAGKGTIILTILGGLLGLGALSLLIVWGIFLRDLPPIESLETAVLPENTRIYDRAGKELYNYGGERRTYVPYQQISTGILDAIVSIEDKTFFTNPGVDLMGMARAGGAYVFGRTIRLQGASTISQQLIKQMFLTSERSLGRKVKEMWLSYTLNKAYSKEKILELYLNKIPFGNNAHGIEEASKTYFGKSAKDVGILGATILASLPRGPSYYSPYQRRDRLMGRLVVSRDGSPEDIEALVTQNLRDKYGSLTEKFREQLRALTLENIGESDLKICHIQKENFDTAFSKESDFSISDEGCMTIPYDSSLAFFNSIAIRDENGVFGTGVSDSLGTSIPVILRYENGRKDLVAERMAEDRKITPAQYRDVILSGLDFEFVPYREAIRAPHFVFYVKEYLENLYGKEFSEQLGLRIYTSIDSDLQSAAEAIIKKQAEANVRVGATNAALVSMDNVTGEILAMVGSADYFNTENGGNVNIITSRRQPGSSFKPIVYALAMSGAAVGPETPIFDTETAFGPWKPGNYDRKFNGQMSVKTALDYSRNIPAVKMWYVAGGEEATVKFAQSIGINSYALGRDYGAPMAIGTAELTPLELMRAYSVFANQGTLRELVPVTRIEDAQGNVLFTARSEEGKQVFSPAASYLLSSILADQSSRPAGWNPFMTLKGRTSWAKTGTANKPAEKKGGPIFPGDVWTAGYTPQITTVVWAGNTDHSAMKGNADGLTLAAPIWRDYMNKAHEKLPKMEFTRPKEGLYSATISRLTGYLARENTPETSRVSGLFAVKPSKYESLGEVREVDTLCNGPVTSQTPPDAIARVAISDTAPIIDSTRTEWLGSVREWLATNRASTFGSSEGIVFETSDTPCVRPEPLSLLISSDLQSGENYPAKPLPFRLSWGGQSPIIRVQVFVGGTLLESRGLTGATEGSENFTIPFTESTSGSQEVTLRAIDKYGYRAERSYRITVGDASSIDSWLFPTITDILNGDADATEPTIRMINPREGDTELSLYEDQKANIRAQAQIPRGQEIIAINVYREGDLENTYDSSSIVHTINDQKNLKPGVYVYTIEAISDSGARSRRQITVTILAR